VAEELANAGRFEEAYEAVKTTQSASLALVDATIRAGDPERALAYTRTFAANSERADGLARVASAFGARKEHERALALLGEALALQRQSRALPAEGDYGAGILNIVQRYIEIGGRQIAAAVVAEEWRQAPSQWILIGRLPAGRSLVADIPSLGMEVYRSFQWVEEFLAPT
jgi:tetratricopeptide (TPR) repeat protein